MKWDVSIIESVVLELLGLAYAKLVLGNGSEIRVCDIETAKDFLNDHVVSGNITEAETGLIALEMHQGHVAESMEVICEKIKAFEMPSEFEPGFEFRIANRDPFTYQYGHIIKAGDDKTLLNALQISHMQDGLGLCVGVSEDNPGTISPLDCINSLKGMIEAGLVMNSSQSQEHQAVFEADIIEDSFLK